MVRPDEISASKAPSTRPLKHCDMKLAQLIIGHPTSDGEAAPQAIASPAARRLRSGSGVVAGIAAEGVGLLHQRQTRNDLEDLPEILFILHGARLLAAHDDDRPHQLMVLLAEVDLADG